MNSLVLWAAVAATLACLAVAPPASAVPEQDWACVGSYDVGKIVCLRDPFSDSADSGRTLICAGSGGSDQAVCMEDPLPA